MKSFERFRLLTQYSLSIGIAAALAASLSVARADTWDKKTIVSFSHAVEVPGYVLPPGKYVMKLVNSQADRHVVQFMNERQNRVYATAIAVPAWRTRITGQTVITFYEAAAGQPEPMKYWYYPGDNFGQEFVYPKEHLREIAAVFPASRDGADAQRRSESTAVAIAEPAPETSAAPIQMAERPAQETGVVEADRSNAPVEIAQAAPPRVEEPATTVQTQPAPEPVELPHTDGNFTGLAMMGMVSLGGALAARKLRRF